MLASFAIPFALALLAGLLSYLDHVREGETAVRRSVAVLEQHVRNILEAEELALARADDHVSGAEIDEATARRTATVLAEIKAPLEGTVSLWVTDAHGEVRASSAPFRSPKRVGDRDFVSAHVAPGSGTFISTMYTGRRTGITSFAVSRRRHSDDGNFDGVLYMVNDSDYFARIFASDAPEMAHVAGLFRTDGAVIAHDPPVPLETRVGVLRLARIEKQPEGGAAWDVSSLDGTHRYYAYRRVGSYPLYVVVGVARAALLDWWWATVAIFASAAIFACLSLLALSTAAVRVLDDRRRLVLQLEIEIAARRDIEARARQGQKMEALGQLVGGVAHDFNNLLMATMTSLELATKRLPDADRRLARLIGNALRSTERGTELTRRLLDFGRTQPLSSEPVDLRRLVFGMSSLLRSSLGSGMRMEMAFPAELPTALADANQLEVALLNLAVNARDATGGAGRIFFSGRFAGGSAEGTRDFVVLSVTDDGSGMDAQTLARAVDPFFTTKGVGEGTGLGLPMVRGFANQAGGRLELRSQPDEGTTAELWLPCGPVAPPKAGASFVLRTAAPPPAPLTVLLVDDDPLVLYSTAALLADLGHTVHEVTSGQQAIDFLQHGTGLDLVITDQTMPGLKGTDVAEAARRLRPGLPVILATGCAEESEVRESGLPVLAKPFRRAELIQTLESESAC